MTENAPSKRINSHGRVLIAVARQVSRPRGPLRPYAAQTSVVEGALWRTGGPNAQTEPDFVEALHEVIVRAMARGFARTSRQSGSRATV